MKRHSQALFFLSALLVLAACGGNEVPAGTTASQREVATILDRDNPTSAANVSQSSVFDLFSNGSDANTTLEVNKYIWRASLEVLDFMPIETVDPFSGVIVMGYGRPPGSSQSYRATVFVQDPALDARSLNVSLATQSGPVSSETTRTVEDAILTRARQLRQTDSTL
ncbi:MAG: DUF3576 domain-containing protein [Rhodobacteraceae bacterium]|nr:DUF3576 domain-containing protein [Paracoccaceae bacterium]